MSQSMINTSATHNARPNAIANIVIAFSPGAQDTMMVLALALHLDPVFVGALQISRFLLVSLLVPFMAHRIRRRAAAQKGAQPPE